MLKKVRIDDNGDTDMFPGALIDMYEFEDKNNEAIKEVAKMLNIDKKELYKEYVKYKEED